VPNRSATKHRAKWRRRALLIAAPGGKIQFAEPTARRWLKQFFSRPARAGMLPRKISRWASGQVETRRRSLVAQTKKAHLYIKREQSYTDRNLVLLLELIRGKSDERSRRHRQLTPREREVLFWLTRGKSNAEIGAILGIASATVNKHLERIYPKLGVENRTAAATSFETEK
jgi:DNA-binding CsgD family transcriptional regulator